MRLPWSIPQLSEAISVPTIEAETELQNETLEELNNTLEVAVGFAKPDEFSLSGLLNFRLSNTIQRPIEGGETVIATTVVPRATRVEAIIKVNIGSVFAELFKQLPSGRWTSVAHATINAINTATLSHRVTSRTRFKVEVTGLGNQDSDYDISGNWDDFL
ncbi:hypothetical protein FNW02_29600 [Komarekiella sp. 'clone 1']|uniref:Uncharacterized protein n=1 Tax=Komarekiella delphini-convector SJRDD-AB1 TaxID=2593771 RepID=A0AA40VU74_9NOST|nr:hypothetical protein [Komarekiella delphini-convector]MBD6619847.1 hypothetical protein [Komarekiella delphini-convector SJRDD-AB1]